jgi:uncharacterized protein YqhQ
MVFWTPASPVVKHGVIILFKLLLMAPISALAYEAIRYAARLGNTTTAAIVRGPGLLLQTLTTRDPDRSQLEVAMVALKEALGDAATATIQTPEFDRIRTESSRQQEQY